MKKDTCTIAVNNFPRNVWAKYTAWVHSNGSTIVDHLEYLLLKTLRDAGVDIPKFVLNDLIKKVCERTKRRNNGNQNDLP